MKKFAFLENHIFFKRKFESDNTIFYYYDDEKEQFHASIFVPKNAEHDFRWNYYRKKVDSDIFVRSDDIPLWFDEMIKESSKIVFYRDRIRRLVRGKSNTFYRK